MKKCLFLVVALLLCIGVCAQDYDVYLCIGQSNMSGRGILQPEDSNPVEGVFLLDSEGRVVPAKGNANIYSSIRKRAQMQGYNLAIPFAARMHARTGRPVLLVVNARGGTWLDQWMKGAPRDTFAKRYGDDPEKIGEPIPPFYAEAVRRGREGMRYGPLKGILWHQGEGDSGEQKRDVYMEKLSTFVSDLRADLDVGTEVPFVVGEVYHFGKHTAINPTLNQVGFFIPNSACASADGCPSNPDHLHFSREGLTLLGQRYADCILQDSSAWPRTYVRARNPFLHQWIHYPSRVVEDCPALPDPDRTDRYGGWADGPRFKKTGYFRTDRYRDRWVLVNPDGHLQLDASVVHIRPGRGDMQKEAFAKKFTDEKDWYTQAADGILSCGFNGSAAFSDNANNAWYNKRHGKRKMSYQVSLSLMAGYGRQKKVTYQLPGHTGYPAGCILVFDPGFEAYCDSVLAVTCPQYRRDKNLVGYYSDNELPFGKGNLEGYLSLPESDCGHQAAIQWLKEKGLTPDQIGDKERCEFAGLVAERYYEIVTRLLRKYDPNHLYLGSRLHGDVKFLKEVVEAAGKYGDVVSYNYYSDWEVRDEDVQRWDMWSGKPFMITEFYTKGEDSGLPNTRGAGWKVPTQDDRGIHYQNFILGLLRTDSCVGWSWFKYQDNDPTDQSADPSNRDSNKGLFDNRYEPYPALAERMTAVNVRRYGLMSLFLDNPAVWPVY